MEKGKRKIYKLKKKSTLGYSTGALNDSLVHRNDHIMAGAE